MTLLAKPADVPVDPLRLARRLGGRRGLAFLHTAARSGRSFLACDPVESASQVDPEPALALAPAGEHGAVPRWIGVLPYEHERGLERPRYRRAEVRPEPMLTRPLWHRYDAVAVIGDRVQVVGESPAAVERLCELLAGPDRCDAARLEPVATRSELAEDARRHRDRIARALELIAAGDLYQVNLARRFDFHASGNPVELLARMSAKAPAEYAAALDLGSTAVVSTSPELFLGLHSDGQVWTSPIKGTRPRAPDAQADRALALELDADPKERAELAMILDVERNDLGRVAATGSVCLTSAPAVVTHATVHHRVATVTARLAPGVSRAQLLAAMLPSGSVTGAPKIRAMEVIADLEEHRRGLYTGAFGVLGHDGGLRLAMAIRVLTVRGGSAHYFAGGGIVADSDPWTEVDETGWKALQVLGGERAEDAVATAAVGSRAAVRGMARGGP